jgi:serine protease
VSLIWPQVASHFNGQIPDGDNGSDPVDPVDPVLTVLEDGVAVSLSGKTGSEQFFSFDVTENKDKLSFSTTGGTGDADLYLKQGAKPSESSYSCRPYKNGNEETCTVNNPEKGTWFAMVKGYQGFTGVALKAQTTVANNCGSNCLQNGVSKSNLAGDTNSQVVYTIEVPAGVTLNVSTSSGSGDADLYVKKGAAPSTTSYDCRPYKNGNNESCDISSGTGGTYFIMLNGYNAYSGLTLIASY